MYFDFCKVSVGKREQGSGDGKKVSSRDEGEDAAGFVPKQINIGKPSIGLIYQTSAFRLKR